MGTNFNQEAKDSEWFRIFQSIAEIATCVLILPGVSEGLESELKYLRNNFRPRRLFLIVPDFRLDTWPSFAQFMNKSGFQLPLEGMEFGSVLGFTNNWSCYEMGSAITTPDEFAEAVVRAIKKGTTSFTGTAQSERQRMLQNKGYKLGWWLSATIYRIFTGRSNPKRPTR